MKLNILSLLGLLTLAAAQSTSTTTSLSPQVSCAQSCNPTDVCCRAACVGVPCPNDSMVNATTGCVAACPKGSGTPSDTASYSTCIQSCYSSLFFPATVTNTGATASGATETSGSSATSSGSSGSGSSDSGSSGSGASATGTASAGSGSGTATAAPSSSSKAAANHQTVQLGASGAGLLGILLAALAL